MPEVKNKDNEGGHVVCVEYEGKFWPPRPSMDEMLNEMKSFKARPEDIWICSWPKSGTHWVWDIVVMLMTDKTEPSHEPKEDYMLEFNFQSHYEKMKSPRVLNTHVLYEDMPPSVWEANSKVIHIMRNPKDSLVSFYHHFKGIATYEFNGTFKAFFDLMMRNKIEYGQWLEYIPGWWEASKKDPNILWLSYEDMIVDLRSNVEKIANFLNLQKSPEYYDAVTDACTFDKMKKSKQQADQAFYPWRTGFEHGMYRKGKVGDWKNHFTVAQSEYFDKVFNEKMKEIPDLKVIFEILAKK